MDRFNDQARKDLYAKAALEARDKKAMYSASYESEAAAAKSASKKKAYQDAPRSGASGALGVASIKEEALQRAKRASALDPEAEQRRPKNGPDPRDPGAMVRSRKPKSPKSPSNAMARVAK